MPLRLLLLGRSIRIVSPEPLNRSYNVNPPTVNWLRNQHISLEILAGSSHFCGIILWALYAQKGSATISPASESPGTPLPSSALDDNPLSNLSGRTRIYSILSIARSIPQLFYDIPMPVQTMRHEPNNTQRLATVIQQHKYQQYCSWTPSSCSVNGKMWHQAAFWYAGYTVRSPTGKWHENTAAAREETAFYALPYLVAHLTPAR